MITKKKILLHALWGGIFGLIAGVITGYGGGFGMPWFELFSIKARYAFFLIPGLFLGLALGIADKSVRKTFYGVLGGLLGGWVFYVIAQNVRNIDVLVSLTFSPIFYIIFICLAFGIMYKSFYKTAKGVISSAISLLVVSLLTVPLLLAYFAAKAWSNYSAVVPCLLISYTLWGIAFTIGIFIGIERGEKKL